MATVTESPNDWQEEYEEFLSVRWEERQYRKQRIANAVSFLQKNQDAPLVKRIDFLVYKGLSQPEIEESFEIAGHLPELIRLMEGSFTQKDMGPTAEELALLNGPQYKTSFRPGDAVFSYVSMAQAYFPAMIVRIDEERDHNILFIRYINVENPEGVQEEWRAPGYKDVVLDRVPPLFVLRPHVNIICRKPARHEMVDGSLLEVHEDGQFCDVDLATCERLLAVPLADVRTVGHPYDLEQRFKEEDAQAKVLRRGNAPIEAVERFPIEGQRERDVQTWELVAMMRNDPTMARMKDVTGCQEASQEDDLTLDERFRFGSSLQNFGRYPYLDVEQKCTQLQTYSELLQKFPRREPAIVDLSAFERHPGCPHLFRYNPILEVARQCRLHDTMFVDSDFPPNLVSLWGPDAQSKTACGVANSFCWQRLGEVYRYPRCFAGELSDEPLKPGPFTAKWMVPIFNAVSRGFEFETLFSPSQSASPFGCYVVRLHIDGQFWYILVDDFIPILAAQGSPACLRSGIEGETWSCLLEKVYAKLTGSYHGLSCTDVLSPQAAFEDLSCGIAHRTQYSLISDPSVWLENMLGFYENRVHCTMLLSTLASSQVSSERKLNRLGITIGSYQVVYHVRGTPDDETSQLIFSGDACGAGEVDERAQDVVLGAYGPRMQQELKKIAARYRAEYRVIGAWLPFLEHLRLFEACLTLQGFWGWKRVLLNATFENRMVCNRFFYNNDRWADNPQVYIRVLGSVPFCAQISLRDARFRTSKPQGKVLRMSLVKVAQAAMLATKDCPLVVTSDLLQLDGPTTTPPLEAHLSTMLDKGHYVLVPEITMGSGTEPFVLKMWSPSDFTAQILN